MPKPEIMAPVVPGSLEDLLIKAGSDLAFVDLHKRDGEGKWLEQRLIARFLGNRDHDADWTRICDGFIFTRNMYPSTPVRLAAFDERKYAPQRDTAAPVLGFERFTTKDARGRTITFYVSLLPKDRPKLPLAVLVQGSGCGSVFPQRDGKVQGGLQNLLVAASKGELRVLVVERPGVGFGDMPKHPGTAQEGSEEFRKEHRLPRWVEAVDAAVRAAHRLPGVDWSRTLVIGHSEGGIVAAHLAAANLRVTHVAILAGGGPNQLFDLMELAARRRMPAEPSEAGQARVQAILDGWAKVQAEPDRDDKFWLGHPYCRWSSFLKTSTLEGLLASRAPVFLAQGTADLKAALAGFEMLRAELAVRHRDVTALLLDHYDHSFRHADDPPDTFTGFQSVLGKAAEWFLSRSEPLKAEVAKELGKIQGLWKVISLTTDGNEQPLAGLVKMQVQIDGDERVLKSAGRVLSRGTFVLGTNDHPRGFDIRITEGGLKGQTLLGI